MLAHKPNHRNAASNSTRQISFLPLLICGVLLDPDNISGSIHNLSRPVEAARNVAFVSTTFLQSKFTVYYNFEEYICIIFSFYTAMLFVLDIASVNLELVCRI